MPPFFRWFLKILLAALATWVVYFNIRLYDRAPCIALPEGRLDVETLDQLHYLRRVLREERAAEAMQDLYPEGFVFTHALYALAWADVAMLLPPESVSRQEGVREMAFSLERLYSEKGKAVFNVHLPLAYGAFYRGWTTYAAGRYLELIPPAERDSALAAAFENDCAAIARTIRTTEEPFLEAYAGQAWPADNVVCLAALALHDRFLNPQFQTVRAGWLGRIRAHLHADYQLIPHDYNPAAHASPESVRGSSQSLMRCFLPEIDSAFAREQYLRYRQQFVAYRLGLPGIREYPPGPSGGGDVDSGPVVLGIGGAASIVGIRAAARSGDRELCIPLRQGVKALLFPRHSGQEFSYLFGQWPVLDAFMAWCGAGLCGEEAGMGGWRWKFQLISLVLLAGGGGLFWKIRRA